MIINKINWTRWAAFLSAISLFPPSFSSSYTCNIFVRKAGSVLGLLKTPSIIVLLGNASIPLEKYCHFHAYNLMHGKSHPLPPQTVMFAYENRRQCWQDDEPLINLSLCLPSKYLESVLDDSQDLCKISLMLCHFILFCIAFSSYSFCTLHIILDTTVSILVAFPL